jgi:hypothetical protein
MILMLGVYLKGGTTVALGCILVVLEVLVYNAGHVTDLLEHNSIFFLDLVFKAVNFQVLIVDI